VLFPTESGSGIPRSNGLRTTLNTQSISTIYSCYSDVFDADYELSMIFAGIDSLHDRKDMLTVRFFRRQVLESSSLLHYLLPD